MCVIVLCLCACGCDNYVRETVSACIACEHYSVHELNKSRYGWIMAKPLYFLLHDANS